MDQTRQSVSASPYGTIISFAIAVVSLVLTSMSFQKNIKPVSQGQLAVFNIATNTGLSAITSRTFDEQLHTNRTLWETVKSKQFHAGLERIESGAWIPPHAHDTEEIVFVYGGQGLLYDQTGVRREVTVGSMIHIGKGVRHAFRNSGTEPMWLMWSFPSSAQGTRFQFEPNYVRE